METVGERIKHLRINNKMTQKEFSEKIGVGRSTLAGYETNQIEPSLNVIFKISSEFGIRPSYFLRTMSVEYPKVEDDKIDILVKLDELMELISSQDVYADKKKIKVESDLSRLIYFEVKQARESIIQTIKILSGKSW